MHAFIDRHIKKEIIQYLSIFPAVVLMGARQCGKSTLIKALAKDLKILYLDLQKESDLNKLMQPNIFFEANRDSLICLDEIQLVPKLFATLRSYIDENRKNGKFILLGSASQNLIQQTSETLAGRIGILYLSPFVMGELKYIEGYTLQKLWMRGGFPDSYLAKSDQNSSIWRLNYIRTFLERDIPQLGIQIPALQLKRLLMMCAHNHGQLLNASKLGESLGMTHPTIKRYIDLLEQTFILRTLLPYETNIKKRLVKSPKVFVRDSGLLHQLLSIDNFNDLLGNPIFGSSWEGFVIENIIVSKSDWNPYFYRTASGDEIDLILEKGNQCIAVECKASSAPSLTKGFWRSLDEVKPDKTYIIALTTEMYALKENVIVCGLADFLKIECTQKN